MLCFFNCQDNNNNYCCSLLITAYNCLFHPFLMPPCVPWLSHSGFRTLSFSLNSFSDIGHITAHMNNKQKNLQTSKEALKGAPVRSQHRSKQQQRKKLHSGLFVQEVDAWLFVKGSNIYRFRLCIFFKALFHKEVLFKPILPNAASLMQFTFRHTQLCRAATLPHLFCSSASLV